MIIQVIKAAYRKLAKYYLQTMHKLSHFYNFGNILYLNCNVTMYNSNDWDKEHNEKNWANFIIAYDRHYEIAMQFQTE
jgi:hypothetical protein